MGRKYTDDVLAALRDPRIAWAASQIGFKSFDSSNDVRAARDYLNRVGGTPWEREIRDANNRTNDLINQMNNLRNSNNQRINDLNNHYSRRISDIINANNRRIQDIFEANNRRIQDINNDWDGRMRNQQANFDRRYGTLDNQYRQLGDRFSDLTTSFNKLGNQYERQGNELKKVTGLYTEQTRLANNKARASVPDPVKSAVSPISGDARESEALGRRRRDNTLSTLTILSGLGAAGATTPGLQIA